MLRPATLMKIDREENRLWFVCVSRERRTNRRKYYLRNDVCSKSFAVLCCVVHDDRKRSKWLLTATYLVQCASVMRLDMLVESASEFSFLWWVYAVAWNGLPFCYVAERQPRHDRDNFDERKQNGCRIFWSFLPFEVRSLPICSRNKKCLPRNACTFYALTHRSCRTFHSHQSHRRDLQMWLIACRRFMCFEGDTSK